MKLKLFSRRSRRTGQQTPSAGSGPQTFRLFHPGSKAARARPAAGRHKLKITFVGDEGKLWRTLALCAAGLVVVIAVLAASRRETQIMNMPEIQVVKEAGVLTVGVRDNMIGMSYNGAGLENELALMLAERILPDVKNGDAVQYVTVSSKTAGAKLSDGAINAAVCMMQKDASAQFAYSDVYFKDAVRFVIRDGERVTAENITVGCIRESVESKRLTTYIEARPASNITMHDFSAYDDMLTALANKKVDAVILTDLYLAKYDDSYDITGTGLDLGTINYAIACPIDTPGIAQAASLMLSELRESGELDALYRKYGFSSQIAAASE